jgi:hypothetical protein
MSSNPEKVTTDKGKERGVATDPAAEDELSLYRRRYLLEAHRRQLFEACQTVVDRMSYIQQSRGPTSLPDGTSLNQDIAITQALGSGNSSDEYLDKPFPHIDVNVARALANSMSDDEKWTALHEWCKDAVGQDEELAKQNIDRTNPATVAEQDLVDTVNRSLAVVGFWMSQQSCEITSIIPKENDLHTAWMITTFKDPPNPEAIASLDRDHLGSNLWQNDCGSS